MGGVAGQEHVPCDVPVGVQHAADPRVGPEQLRLQRPAHGGGDVRPDVAVRQVRRHADEPDPPPVVEVQPAHVRRSSGLQHPVLDCGPMRDALGEPRSEEDGGQVAPGVLGAVVGGAHRPPHDARRPVAPDDEAGPDSSHRPAAVLDVDRRGCTAPVVSDLDGPPPVGGDAVGQRSDGVAQDTLHHELRHLLAGLREHLGSVGRESEAAGEARHLGAEEVHAEDDVLGPADRQVGRVAQRAGEPPPAEVLHSADARRLGAGPDVEHLRPRLDEHAVDATPPQLERGRKSGRTAADDHDVARFGDRRGLRCSVGLHTTMVGCARADRRPSAVGPVSRDAPPGARGGHRHGPRRQRPAGRDGGSATRPVRRVRPAPDASAAPGPGSAARRGPPVRHGDPLTSGNGVLVVTGETQIRPSEGAMCTLTTRW